MKQVLVVDDSISVRKALERILKPKNVEVLSADSAKVALDILEQQHPALIIADIVMPEMDGYEFCSLLKEHERLKTVPVLLISGIVNPEVKSRAKDVKAIGIVKKPFKPDTLLYIVSLIFEKLKTRATSEQAITQTEATTQTQTTTQTEATTAAVVPDVETTQAIAEPSPSLSTMPVDPVDALPVDNLDAVDVLVDSQPGLDSLALDSSPAVESQPLDDIPVEVLNLLDDKPVDGSFEGLSPVSGQAESSVTEQAQVSLLADATSTENASDNVDLPHFSKPQSANGYDPGVLEAAATRFKSNVNVDNLWLLNTEAQCLLHLGSERKQIDSEVGEYFEVFYRTARDFAKITSNSSMNSLFVEYPETCYFLVKVNEGLLMVLDFQDVSALSMVRYMMRKELPELVTEIEAMPIAS